MQGKRGTVWSTDFLLHRPITCSKSAGKLCICICPTLKEAENMAGFDNSNKTGTEANFIANVVEDILTKLNRKLSSDLKGLVGIEWKIEQIEGSLCINSPDVFSAES
ncbi:uncharacterized protein LOC117637676 [Prunus dulcis]|uniref:uncharacterized protein LOC117637676 n=1 Tax=Prunus dulcis TaxID=3755 RepID=UPI0014836AB1|nr:uncharacterized protein LOC117637676 [Prunus dulcis]